MATRTTQSGRSAATVALHGRPGRRESGPLVPGICQSTTYLHRAVGECDGPTYSRVGNPSVDHLEEVLGALEDAPASVTFGTGLGAETALFLALLKAGDHAVVGDGVYGGTTRLFRQVLAPLGISATFVDTSDVAQVAGAIRAETKLIFVETPTNPTLKLTDIRSVAALARATGVKLVVDNTFLTPVLQRPLDLGADVSVYSTTKHIDGHSVALGGAVTTRDEDLIARVRFIRKATGGIQAPFNAWLTVQGIKTLPLRLERQSEHAQVIAEWLSARAGVARVNYPGLDGHPQAEIAARQHIGGLHGGVISFELEGGVEAGVRLLNGVRLCRLVEHVGSVETLITHPASMTHADVPREQRALAGISDGLVRLSVGLEEPAEVIQDLDRAIEEAGLEDTALESGATRKSFTEGGVACLVK
jgi:cystathionine beta-lyase/cystathionine gamma-synthase